MKKKKSQNMMHAILIIIIILSFKYFDSFVTNVKEINKFKKIKK